MCHCALVGSSFARSQSPVADCRNVMFAWEKRWQSWKPSGSRRRVRPAEGWSVAVATITGSPQRVRVHPLNAGQNEEPGVARTLGPRGKSRCPSGI